MSIKVDVSADFSSVTKGLREVERDAERIGPKVNRALSGGTSSPFRQRQEAEREARLRKAMLDAERRAQEELNRTLAEFVRLRKEAAATPAPAPMPAMPAPAHPGVAPTAPPLPAPVPASGQTAIAPNPASIAPQVQWRYRQRPTTQMAGVAGGALAGALTGGGFGMGSLLGGLAGMIPGAGAFLGPLVGGIGGALDRGMGSAKDEAIGIADLRRSLGAAAVEFDLLRNATRGAADGLGVTYTESVKLAGEFAHVAGLRGEEAGGLSGELRNAIGFSRGLGLDPSHGASFFGTMRHFGAAKDEASARRMSMMLADAIQRGGMGSKADEVLGAVSNFASIAARASLTAPNVAGYSSMLGSLNALRLPGLDVQGAASIMSRADASFRGEGGNAAENYKLGAFQHAFGRNTSALDLEMFKSVGLYGSIENEINSRLEDPNLSPERRHRYKGILASGNAGKAPIDLLMSFHRSQYAQGSDFYDRQGAGLFNLSEKEFRGLNSAYDIYGQAGGMEAALKASGIDTSRLSPIKHMTMAAILGGDRQMLDEQANKLIKGDGYDRGLDKGESDQLAGLLKGGDTDALRTAVLKANETRELIDDGDKTRKEIAGVANALTDMSTPLLPAVNSIREAILAVAGKDNGWLAKQQESWAMKPYDDKLAAAKKRVEETAPGWMEPSSPKHMDARADLERAALERQEALEKYRARVAESAGVKDPTTSDVLRPASIAPRATPDLPDDESKVLDNVARKSGLSRRLFEKVLALEKSGATAVSPKGARGRFQIMPGNLKPGEDPTDFATGAEAAARVLQDARRLYGDNEAAILAYYNGGKAAGDAVAAGRLPPSSETRKYLERNAKLGAGEVSYNGQVPAEHRRRDQASMIQGSADVSITLRDSSGRERADPVRVPVRLGPPSLALA